jgi:major type 1 subunit fimbrin (pilin)
MKIRKSALAIVLLTTLTAAAVTHATTIGGGTITFIGTITDNTCSVEGGAGTSGGLDDFSVTLEPVKAFELNAAGVTAKPKAFNIIIGGPGQGTCVDGKIGSMYFLPESPQVSAVTGNLENTLPDEATNVEIQLLNNNQAPIDLRNEESGMQPYTISDNQAELTYYAQYHATGAATPGLIDTNVIYAVDMN